MTIQTRLFKAKPKGSGGTHLRLPKWYTLEGLPKDLQKLLQVNGGADVQPAPAGGTGKRPRKGGRKPKAPAKPPAEAKKTAKATSGAKVAKTRSRQAARPKPNADVQPGSAQQTLLKASHVHAQAPPDSESPARKRPCRTKGRTRGELRSLSPVAFPGMPSADASSPCGGGGGPAPQAPQQRGAACRSATEDSAQDPSGGSVEPPERAAAAEEHAVSADGHQGDEGEAQKRRKGGNRQSNGNARSRGAPVVRKSSGQMCGSDSDADSEAISPGQENKAKGKAGPATGGKAGGRKRASGAGRQTLQPAN